MKKGLIFFASCILFITNAFCQKHEVGASLGGLNYTGDLSPDYNVKSYGFAGSGFYKLNFSPAFGLRCAILLGEFSPNDKYNKDPLPVYRNIKSSTTLGELSLLGEYNFFDFRKDKDRRRISPYLCGGIGFYIYSQQGKSIKSQDGGGISIPFGVGVKYKLTRQVNIGAEFIARKTFTDQLDGVESVILANGIQGGDTNSKDWYYYTGLTISYTMYSVECPKHFR